MVKVEFGCRRKYWMAGVRASENETAAEGSIPGMTFNPKIDEST